MSGPKDKEIDAEQQKEEKNKAFDLLDALTRSGSLPIDFASLHIMVAATHCFGETLMNSVLKENINPIEKVERSTLIMATSIHNRVTNELIQPSELERVSTFSPKLITK